MNGLQNFKIRVTNESESKEAQELFVQLGFKLNEKSDKQNYDQAFALYAYSDNPDLFYSSRGDDQGKKYFENHVAKEINLPQLRDMVVLHRNDVSDANYTLFVSTSQSDLNLYKTSDDVFYVFDTQLKGWDKSRSVGINTHGLKPIQKPQDQDLISGAEALRALADGKEVLWKCISESHIDAKRFIDHPPHLATALHPNCNYQFWIKPSTIKIGDVDVPAPFELKVGDRYWSPHPAFKSGYAESQFSDAERHADFIQLGAWRTEEEIKQVVAALRKVLKGESA